MPILPNNDLDYIDDETEDITSEDMTDGSSVTENNATYNDPFDYTGPSDIGVPDALPVDPVVPESSEDRYYVIYYNRGDLTDYEPAYLQELAEAGCKFYAIYDDETEVEIQWTDIEDLDPLETEIDLSEAIASASNQHFWDDTNGVHVSEVAKEDWQTALEANFADLSSSKNYYNILMNSLGLLLRRANFNLTSINRAAISFYDGLGNDSVNVMASFGRNSAQIGRSTDKHVVINDSGLTAYNSDGSLAPLTGTFDGANINNSSITNSKIVDGTIEGSKIASATIDNSNIKNGTIEGSKIASATIDNSNIKNGTIEGSKIKGGTITGSLIADGTIENTDIKNGTITGTKIASATIDDSNIKNGTITGTKIAESTIENSNIKDGTITGTKIQGSTLTNIPYAGITDADIEVARVANAEIAKAEVNYAHITNGVIDNAKIDKADVNGLAATYATITNLNAATARIGTIESDYLKAADMTAEQARVGTLLADKADVDDLSAAMARIGTLEADHVSVDDFEAEQANIDNLQAATADIETIRANSAKVQNLTAAELEADHATVGNLAATYATIDSLDAAEGRIGTLETENTNVKGRLTAAEGNITTLNASKANVTDLTAATGRITNLESTKADISVLESDYITADTIEATYTKTDFSNTDVAWIQNGVIKDGSISSAMINSVSANKLTAGTINGSVINVTNLNADNITAGTINGQRIGEGSLSLSKLDEDVYTEAEVDAKLSTMQSQIDGAIETWTGTSVPTLQNSPASSWNTTALKDSHVGDVYFVVNSNSQQNGYNYRFTKSGSTYSWQLIKDSDVTNALQRLNTAEGKITTFDSDISQLKTDTGTLTTKTTSLETRMSNAEDDILDKVDTTTFNEVSDTVDGHSQSISQMSTTLSNKADSSTVSAVTQRVSKNEQDISGINTTIGTLQTTVASKADGSTVETMSTKLNTVSDTVDGHTQSISSITSTQTTMQGKLDKTLVETTQLWFTKANTTAPAKPTAHVTTNNAATGNAWNLAVPTYNSAYPNYYYCYEYQYVDGSYGWSAVTRDIATGEMQATARQAQSDIDNLEIGGRNLLKGRSAVNSWTANGLTVDYDPVTHWMHIYGTNTKTDAAYSLVSFSLILTQELVVGDEYTLTMYSNDYETVKENVYIQCNYYRENDTQFGIWGINHTAGHYPSVTQKCPNDYVYHDAYLNAFVGIRPTARDIDVTFRLKFEKGNRATDWTPAPEDVDADISTAQTSADNAQATANKNVKESQQLWFTKANGSAPNKPTAKVTSTSTGGNAWTTKVPTYNASYPHYFYCMQYIAADGTVTWSDVVYDQATTEAQSVARTASANLTTLQQDYATFKQTTQNFESTIGTTYATKTELQTTDDKIDNLEIGGRNLLSKRQIDPSNWIHTIANTTTYTGDGYENTWTMVKTSAYEQCYLPVTVSQDTEYTFSLEYIVGKAYNRWIASTPLRFQILPDVPPNADNRSQEIAAIEVPSVVTSATRDSVTFTAPSDTIYLNIAGGYVADGTTNLSIEFNYLKLEKGNRATDWSPAPEDVDAGISSIETRLSTAETSITQNNQQIALKANASDVYTKTQTDGLISTEVSNRNSAIEQSASAINLSVSQNYTTKTEFNALEIGGRGTWYADWPRPVTALELGHLSEKKYIEEAGFIQDFSKKFCMRVDFMRSSSYQTQRYCLASSYGLISADTNHSYPELGIELQQNSGRLRIYSLNDSNSASDKVVGTAPELDIWSTALVWWDPETKEITWLLVSGDRSETGHYAPSGTYSRKSGLVRLGADNRVDSTWNVKYYQRDIPPIWYEEPPEDPKNLCRWSLIETAEGTPKSASPVECSSSNASIEAAKSEIKATTDSITSTVSKISSAKYLESAISGGSALSSIRSYASTTTTFTVVSNANARIGDTIYLKYKDSTRNCYVYIKGTVTSLSGTTSVTLACHGYEDILPVDTIKSTINQSSDSVKIQAKHVEIDGAAIFSNSAFKAAADAAYDAKGSASAVQTNLDNLEIGGRNLLYKRVSAGGRTTANGDYSIILNASENLDTYFYLYTRTKLVEGTAYVISCEASGINGESVYYKFPLFRQGSTISGLTINRNGINLFSFIMNSTELEYNVASTVDGLTVYRITMDDQGRNIEGQTGPITLTNFKLEKGNRATDWTPAPEDVDASIASVATTANNAAPKSSAVAEEQYIYRSAASGTTSISGTTTWIAAPTSATASTQNAWTTKRPEYSSSYPVLFVAKQRKMVNGTITCTTPAKDDTTTIIDGGHITTGTIDTNRLNADTIKSNIVQTTELNADKITSGTINTNRLNADTIKSNIVQTTELNADKITSGTIAAARIAAGSIAVGKIDATSGTFNTANIPDLNASKITAGDIAAARIKANVITAINSLTAGTIDADRIDASSLRIGYSQLNNPPTIPSKVSQLTNDSGYATTEQAQGYANAKDSAIAAAAKRTDVSIAVTAINYDLGTATLQATLYIDGTATTSGVTYKWLKDGAVISGQTARTLSVTAAMGLSHVYSCTVTYS